MGERFSGKELSKMLVFGKLQKLSHVRSRGFINSIKIAAYLLSGKKTQRNMGFAIQTSKSEKVAKYAKIVTDLNGRIY